MSPASRRLRPTSVIDGRTCGSLGFTTDERRPEPEANHLRILVVEDNAVNQIVATQLLDKLGHISATASNGREALTALAAESFDLVLMDIQMPEMDGVEAAQLVRGREGTDGGHLPIIAMTANAIPGDRERYLESGMDGYVAKPIRTNELAQAIEAALRIGRT
jgi:CheY-like chemotaxis protein